MSYLRCSIGGSWSYLQIMNSQNCIYIRINFSFLIRKIFEQMIISPKITIKIKIKIGEMIRVNGKNIR